MSEVAIVTGAAGGIGAATAARFAAEGRAVLVADVDEAGAARVADELRAAGGEAAPCALDVTSRSGWEGAVEAARALGRLTAVVNNAGIVRDASLRKMTDEQWSAVIDVHLRGAFLGCQVGARELTEQGGGTIVSIASTSIFGSFGQANYSAAKGGVVALTRTVAIECAKRGVRANAVAPGCVATPMMATVPDGVRDQLLAETPLRRFAEPEEIAALVWFLSSPESAFITGQTVVADGGITLGG